MRKSRRWTEKEKRLLRESYVSNDYADIARRLDRTMRAVQTQAERMGIHSKRLKRWTDEEDEILRELAKCKSHAEIADTLRRAPSEVSSRLKRLGINLQKRTRRVFKKGRNGELHSGYWMYRWTDDDGKRHSEFEHVVAMEENLGRHLDECEKVHHINGLSFDNRLDNLFLCKDKSEHLRVHRSLEKLLPVLVASGIIRFNRCEGVYEVCRTSN